MAALPELVPRANCVVNLQKHEIIDLEPWRDIRDTPEDRELYPNDWMDTISMSEEGYEDLLNRVRHNLQAAVPWLHPNKALWITLRQLVNGDSVRASEEAEVVGACKAIFAVLQDEFYPMPNISCDGTAWADDFESLWNIHNCLGAIAVKRIESEHLDLYMTSTCGQKFHADTYWAVVVNAQMEVVYSTMATGIDGQTFDTLMDHCNLGQEFKTEPFPVPPPRAPMGSTVKQPLTFIGDHKLGARKWLRVATNGKDEEIQRAMKIANISMHILVSRFGILKLKHPLPLLHARECICTCLVALHNYFMRKNPAYGDLKRMLGIKSRNGHSKQGRDPKEKRRRRLNAEPEPVPPPKQNSKALWNIERAIQRMKMDTKSLQRLMQKTRMPVEFAVRFFTFIGLGNFEEDNYFGLGMGLSPLYRCLSKYAQKLPLSTAKWLQIANDFQVKLQIPNCAGVLATKRVAIYCKDSSVNAYGVLVMIIDANYRVSYSELVLRDLSVAETVAYVLDKEKLNLPKSLVFIGSEGLDNHRLLVRLGDNYCHLAHVNRALLVSEKLMDTLVDRFAVMDNSVARRTTIGAPCASFVGSVLHNFLMDNSYIYAEGFLN